jgi:RNA polymerase sigma-70 factor (ECF subfamily)
MRGVHLAVPHRHALRRPARPAPLPLEAALEVVCGAAPMDEVVESRRTLARVAAALEALSLEQRAVLGLSAIEGLSHRAIAEVLGIPEGTVGSRLFQARKRVALLMASAAQTAPR